MSKSIAETRVETQLLVERLRKLEEGETVSYSELNQICGADVQTVAAGWLRTARKRVEQEEKRIFDVVRGEAIKRLSPSDSVGLISANRVKIRKFAKRTLRRTECIQWDKLNKEEQLRLNLERTVAATVSVVSTDKQAERLTASVAANGNPLPFTDVCKKMIEKMSG